MPRLQNSTTFENFHRRIDGAIKCLTLNNMYQNSLHNLNSLQSLHSFYFTTTDNSIKVVFARG